MSSSKVDASGVFAPIIIQTSKSHLRLPSQAVRIRPNGIEFLSPTSLPAWAELTIDLQLPGESHKTQFSGVVVQCTGDRHMGYVVSIVFTELSEQSAHQLSVVAGIRGN